LADRHAKEKITACQKNISPPNSKPNASEKQVKEEKAAYENAKSACGNVDNEFYADESASKAVLLLEQALKRDDGLEARALLPAMASTVGSELVTRSLSALAKFVADRGKRELMGWTLDRVAADICTYGGDDELGKALHAELKDKWVRHLCDLAAEDRLDHYGGGEALLLALRAALEADVRSWPGVLVGLGLKEMHLERFTVSKENERKDICPWFEATSGTPTDCLRQGNSLRTGGEDFVDRLMRGESPLNALAGLSDSIAEQVTSMEATATEHKINDVPLALMACGISIPEHVAQFAKDYDGIAPNVEVSGVIAALAATQACWQLTGEGFANIGSSPGSKQKALTTQNVERLSTVIRLHRELVKPAAALGREVKALSGGLKSVEDAGLALQTARQTGKDVKGARAELWNSVLLLLDSGIALSKATLVVVDHYGKSAATFPGLSFQENTTRPLDEHIEKIRNALTTLKAVLDVAKAIGTDEMGIAVIQAMTQLSPRLTKLCAADESKKCKERFDSVARHLGLIVAVLEAKTDEEMAKAIDAAANPPGGWRTKLSNGNFTVGLSAYPGFFAAFESRWGTYGATLERGEDVYKQRPTLTLPIGVDLVWGVKKTALGLFASVLDPVAFLQYDVDSGGRLPGPRPVTVIAPGLFFRMNLGPTPIALLLGVVYRPQFRTWEATVSGPGANVLQYGIALTVDATLWKLYSNKH
jgi:hypothetical protein